MQQTDVDHDAVRAAWRGAHLVPLWESPTAHKPPPQPEPPHVWRWDTIRPLIGEAIKVTSPDAVERRVLSLVNPRSRSPDDEATMRTVSAAIQVLLPGESARPHRHSMNALRFVLEGSGAVTIVNGKPCPMAFGDLIITPAWCWHEHQHRGTEPMIWLDALDVPLHLYLGTAAFEPGPVKAMPQVVDERAFSVPNILPEVAMPEMPHSPVFRYPYAAAAHALEAAPLGADGARRVRYVNPLTGGSSMPLLDSGLIQIDPNDETSPVRTNSHGVCLVAEGAGESAFGDQTINWRQRDVFTLPPGHWVSHRAGPDGARLFVVSDRDVLSRLGLLREEHGNRRAR